MNGDRDVVAGVVDAVDVAGGSEAVDVADEAVAATDQVEVGVEDVLVLDALDDAEGAPGDVVVDPCDLPGRQTRATIENDPSGATCRLWAQ